MRKIAIITRNQQLSELCSLEIRLAGYSSEVFENPDNIYGFFDIVLWDEDTVVGRIQDNIEGITVYMSERFDKLGKDRLRLPISLLDLRGVIQGEASENRNADNCSYKNSVIEVIDTRSRTVSYGGARLAFSENEFIIINKLNERFGDIVSRDELNELLGVEKGNIIDVYICRIRNKFEKITQRKIIGTVHSKGYKLLIPMVQ